MTTPRTILKTWNLHAKKKLGQNFLSDPSTSTMITDRAAVAAEDVVVEIGPGLGALTVPMASRARKVYAVEKDSQILPLLRSELAAVNLENVEIINNDILKVNLEDIAAGHANKLVVVGNLPYNISSQILVRLIAARPFVSRGVFMLQKELAERLCAAPGGKDYGRLTAMLQYCAEIRDVAEVKAHLFYPKPKVDSQVIEIRFHEAPEYPATDEMFLFAVIKAAFSKRRKTLKNALSKSELALDTDLLAAAFEASEIDPVRRAETLENVEFVKLSNCLHGLLHP